MCTLRHSLLCAIGLLIAYGELPYTVGDANGSQPNIRQLTIVHQYESCDRASGKPSILSLTEPEPLPALASKHQDPRHLDACRALHKPRLQDSFSVNTIEDVIAHAKLHANSSELLRYRDRSVSTKIWEQRRIFERHPRSQACGLLHPYGRFVQSRDSQQPRGILYVEIPKSSSTTIKTWISALCKDPEYGAGGYGFTQFSLMAPVLPKSQLSFTVVREPLARFISGYGTIRNRVLLRGKHASYPGDNVEVDDNSYLASRAAEVDRFKDFVKLVFDEGPMLQARHQKDDNCQWCHIFSQMWFIEMYPQPINFVLHVESLVKDIALFRRYLPVKLPSVPPRHMNSHEGAKSPGYLEPRELIAAAPSAIKMALEYLRQDYVCLQYPFPPMATKRANRTHFFPPPPPLPHQISPSPDLNSTGNEDRLEYFGIADDTPT